MYPTNQSVLITGGAGFIGSHLTNRLALQNDVTVYDNFTKNSLKYHDVSGLKVVQADVLDAPQLESFVLKSSYVIHCAATVGPLSVAENGAETITNNFMGTWNLLEACKKADNLKRIVLFSTSEVYGSNPCPVTESSPTPIGKAEEPRWSYACSKLLGDHLALSLYKTHGLPVVIVRPFNFYGPYQEVHAGGLRNLEHAVPKFVAQALRGDPLTIYGAGDDVRSWCYIDEAIFGIMACLTCETAVGEIFNLGNPACVLNTLALAQTIIEVTNSSSNLQFVQRPTIKLPCRLPNIDKGKSILNFKPQITLKEGIRRIVQAGS